jgi:hypothetical protein
MLYAGTSKTNNILILHFTIYNLQFCKNPLVFLTYASLNILLSTTFKYDRGSLRQMTHCQKCHLITLSKF